MLAGEELEQFRAALYATAALDPRDITARAVTDSNEKELSGAGKGVPQ
jgi:aspartate oxidase